LVVFFRATRQSASAMLLEFKAEGGLEPARFNLFGGRCPPVPPIQSNKNAGGFRPPHPLKSTRRFMTFALYGSAFLSGRLLRALYAGLRFAGTVKYLLEQIFYCLAWRCRPATVALVCAVRGFLISWKGMTHGPPCTADT